jgi:hypothetical protein
MVDRKVALMDFEKVDSSADLTAAWLVDRMVGKLAEMSVVMMVV